MKDGKAVKKWLKHLKESSLSPSSSLVYFIIHLHMLLISAYKVLRFIICWLQNSVIGFNGDISWFFFSLWRLTASFSPSKYLRWHVIPHNKLLWKCIFIFIISRSFHSQKQNNKTVLNRI